MEKIKPLFDQLRDDINTSKKRVDILKIRYESAKELLKKAEKDYKEAKTIRNKKYKAWFDERKKLEKLLRRPSQKQSYIRQKTKKDFGKVWDQLSSR